MIYDMNMELFRHLLHYLTLRDAEDLNSYGLTSDYKQLTACFSQTTISSPNRENIISNLLFLLALIY